MGAFIGVISQNTFAKDDSKEALTAVSKMLHTQDHIQTIQCDVLQVKTIDGKAASINYSFKADSKGNAVAVVKSNSGSVTYVKNFKGLYLVAQGRARKLPKNQSFPFDNPGTFLKQLALSDVTPNSKFVVESKTTSQVAIGVIRVSGFSKNNEGSRFEPVRKLRLTLNLPFYTLGKVEMFTTNLSETQNYIEFEHGPVTNKKVPMASLFKSRPETLEMTSMVHSKSVALVPGIREEDVAQLQVKESWYRNIVINDVLEKQLFNEEGY